MEAPQEIVLPGEVMASSIVRSAAPFPGQSEARTKFELTDFDNLEGKPAFKIVLLSNLGWLPPLRSLMSQWWPIILIIVGILVLIRRSSGGKSWNF
ncbi:MAG: hypothetical protein ACLQGU_00625 [bacterium]